MGKIVGDDHLVNSRKIRDRLQHILNPLRTSSKREDLNLIRYVKRYDAWLKIFPRKIKLKKKINQNKAINFLYFSCGKHYSHLVASLRSLQDLKLEFKGATYLYIDKSDFLTRKQIIELKRAFSNIVISKTHHNMQWGGPHTLINELRALRKINSQVGPRDYIAKIDSDMFFISRKIFDDVIKLDCALAGQSYTNKMQFTYIQGGCYFINNSIVPYLLSHPLYTVILDTLKNIHPTAGCTLNNFPEDAVIFNVIKENTNDIKFIDFYITTQNHVPKNQAITENHIAEWKKQYSALHFERDRARLEKLIDSLAESGVRTHI